MFEKKELDGLDIDRLSLASFTTDEESEEIEKDEMDGKEIDFGKKANRVVQDNRPKSVLAQQLQELEAHGSNPFFKYAKFDGRVSL